MYRLIAQITKPNPNYYNILAPTYTKMFARCFGAAMGVRSRVLKKIIRTTIAF